MPSAKGGSGKMLSLINYRLRVTLSDGRQIIGQLLAFDAHMNVVLSESEEFRRLKRSKKSKAGSKGTSGGDGDDEEVAVPEPEQKRTLGLIILRGESIVSLSVEAPPPQVKEKPNQLVAGPGRGAPAGRGMGLTAPPPGASMAGRPMNYPPPGMPGLPTGPPPGFRPPGMPGGPPVGMPGGPPPGMPYGRPPPFGFPRPPQ